MCSDLVMIKLKNIFSGLRGRPQRDLRPGSAEGVQQGDEARAQAGLQAEVRQRAQRGLHQVSRKGVLMQTIKYPG